MVVLAKRKEILNMNGYRTIKITAGMTQEFEIIWTNAPDHVIKAQLMYIAKGAIAAVEWLGHDWIREDGKHKLFK